MTTKAEIVKAVRRLERADTEYYRALLAWEQPRLANAGTAYTVAKAKLFKLIGSLPREER